MVATVRRGASLRSVARKFCVALRTVQRWVDTAQGQRLDRVCFADHPAGPKCPANRTSQQAEARVLSIRRELRDESALGEFGAAAIHRELESRGTSEIPSIRTINNILARRGALDYRHRVRHQPPPKGWYLPEVAARRAELDEFDVITGLVIEGGIDVEVLTAMSRHGGLAASWPQRVITAEITRHSLLAHWQQCGLPEYAQFDNDTRFQGPHQYPDTIGTVIRMCLSLAVVPVFAPVREMGMQNAIESFNGRWQAKVWSRFHHQSLAALQAQSAKYVAAGRVRAAARIEAAPERRPFPADWRLNLKAAPHGQILFVRRTSGHGQASVLGRVFEVDRQWVHRLVRCEVDIDAGVIRFYALRRREPARQPLLREVAYVLSRRYFKE